MSGPHTDFICYQHTENGFFSAHIIKAEGVDSLTGHCDFSRKFWMFGNINVF
jgi:hypothetical protein